MADKIKSEDKTISAELRGETIAYAVQSCFYNLGANFIEPYINHRTQKYYSAHDVKHPAYGNYLQNLAGEFAGDVSGAAALIGAEMLFPKYLHAGIRTMRSWVDPLYTSVAQRVFAGEEKNPNYEKEMQAWKVFQERNLVRSVIIASGSIAGNIATQKLLAGNPSPASVIFKGKLLSSAITTGCGLAFRFAFPEQTRKMDGWLGKNMFMPMLSDIDRESGEVVPSGHAARLAKETATVEPAR